MNIRTFSKNVSVEFIDEFELSAARLAIPPTVHVSKGVRPLIKNRSV